MEEEVFKMTQEEINDQKDLLCNAFSAFFSVKSGIIPHTFELDAIGSSLSFYNDLLNKISSYIPPK